MSNIASLRYLINPINLYRNINYSKFNVLNTVSISTFNKNHIPIKCNTKSYPKHLNLIQTYSTEIKSKTSTCWKCGASNEITALFCSCGIIQKPHSNNYFEILNLDSTYNISVGQLMINFKNLQKQLHPDKFATKTEEERNYSAEYSSLVNKAYQILYRPISRALYILELHGKVLEEGKTQVESDFLIDIMEVNEKLTVNISEDELIELKLENAEHISEVEAKLSKSFEMDDYDSAKELAMQLKYYNNITEKINDIELEKEAEKYS